MSESPSEIAFRGVKVDVYVYLLNGKDRVMRVTTHEAASAGSEQGLAASRLRQSPKSPSARKHRDQLMRLVLAASVRRHRLGRHWSVETLAARSQLTPVFIGQIEEGTSRL